MHIWPFDSFHGICTRAQIIGVCSLVGCAATCQKFLAARAHAAILHTGLAWQVWSATTSYMNFAARRLALSLHSTFRSYLAWSPQATTTQWKCIMLCCLQKLLHSYRAVINEGAYSVATSCHKTITMSMTKGGIFLQGNDWLSLMTAIWIIVNFLPGDAWGPQATIFKLGS